MKDSKDLLASFENELMKKKLEKQSQNYQERKEQLLNEKKNLQLSLLKQKNQKEGKNPKFINKRAPLRRLKDQINDLEIRTQELSQRTTQIIQETLQELIDECAFTSPDEFLKSTLPSEIVFQQSQNKSKKQIISATNKHSQQVSLNNPKSESILSSKQKKVTFQTHDSPFEQAFSSKENIDQNEIQKKGSNFQPVSHSSSETLPELFDVFSPRIESVQEKPKETPKEKPKVISQTKPKETPKETIKEKPKETIKEKPKIIITKETPKETIKPVFEEPKPTKKNETPKEKSIMSESDLFGDFNFDFAVLVETQPQNAPPRVPRTPPKEISKNKDGFDDIDFDIDIDFS